MCGCVSAAGVQSHTCSAAEISEGDTGNREDGREERGVVSFFLSCFLSSRLSVLQAAAHVSKHMDKHVCR